MSADSQATAAPSISVIMPVYNGLEFLDQSLPPLIAMSERGELAEVIVVDDGSTDATPQRCRELGAKVIDSGGRLGPGGARNRAASIAVGELLWFVDADVVVHEDAARALAQGFDDDSVVAVFGSYDDKPPAENFFSQYKNLVHHYYHQRAANEASTFWSGCGAVRRQAFLERGGFDVETYRQPSIEDIELGHRLIRADGKIRLQRSLQCTHLKVWRFWNMIHTEIFRRAIPWSRLIISSGEMPKDLNAGPAEQLRALLAGLALLALLAVTAGWLAPWVIAVVFAAVLAANFALARLFYERAGALFALAGLLFHQIYYLYSSAAFAWVVFEQLILRRPAGPGSG